VFSLLRGRYLLVMTGSTHVATVQGCPIRQLVDSKIIPFNGDKYSSALTAEQEKEEATYLSMLRAQLHCGFFYFSYDYDLTLSTQRIAEIRSDAAQSALPLWKRADTRFFWNSFLSRELMAAGSSPSAGTSSGGGIADDFILPLINGYVFQQHQKIKGHDVTFVLISRRSHERTGRRFVQRGLDEQGHAANFAEAEQVGTIPLRLTDAVLRWDCLAGGFFVSHHSLRLLILVLFMRICLCLSSPRSFS